jgi:hypothetical protein
MANSKRTCVYKPCRASYRPAEGILHPSKKFGWCGSECRIKWAAANAPKFVVKAKQEFKRETVRKRKVYRSNDLPHQLDLTRRAFNTMIRWLDRGKNCPTCGEPLEDGYYDAGHVRTVASCGALRFDARNCFGQCTGCNGTGLYRKKTKQTQETVIERYKVWVLNTLGQVHYDWLFGPHQVEKWTCEGLLADRLMFLEETRRLKDGEPPSRDWRALPPTL